MRNLMVLLALLTAALPLRAGDVEVSVGAVGAANRHFGVLTPSAWRFHDERGAGIGVDWFFNDLLSLAAAGAEVREHARFDGQRTSAFRSVPATLLLEIHAPAATVRPYFGAGVSYLMYRSVVRSPYGVPEQPDHAALMLGGGIDYALSRHWILNLDGKYGPARSTAEVNTPQGTVQRIDFHELYVSSGIRYRFW